MRENESTDHCHPVYGFRFPFGQRRVEDNIIMLQNSETEGDQGIVRTQAGPVREAHRHPIFGVRYSLDSSVQQNLFLGKAFSGLRLNDAREAALISRQEVISRKTALVAVEGEVIRLYISSISGQICDRPRRSGSE